MNPFVGPQPFDARHRLYGRNLEISELRYYVGAKRIVLFHSPSGAGKSSVIGAQNGLIAKLRDSGRFDVWGPARVNGVPDGFAVANPFAWSAITEFEKSRPEGPRPGASFASTTLAEYVSERYSATSHLLIFDQFEEVLRANSPGNRLQYEFFDQLGELLRNPRVWALFAMREDYLAAIQPFARQLPTHLQNRYRIDFLRREDQAVDTITGPLREAPYGRVFGVGVVEEMLANLAKVRTEAGEQLSDTVEPLQIQVVCRNLWERIQKKDPAEPISAADFGDIDDALGAYYRNCVSHKDAKIERRIRTWFNDRLITADKKRDLVRSDSYRDAGLDDAEIERLLGTYLVRQEPRAGAMRFELSHDRLIDPVRESNAEWFEGHLTEFQRRARRWQLEKENPSLLMLGREIDGVESEGENEARFLAASRQARARRRTKLAVGAAFVVTIAALGIYAWIQKNEAERTLRLNQTFVARGLVTEAYNRSLNRPNESLAFLEDALKNDPASQEARSWLMSILLDRQRWLPVGPAEAFTADPGLSIVANAGDSLTHISRDGKEVAVVTQTLIEAARVEPSGSVLTRRKGESAGVRWRRTQGPEDVPALDAGGVVSRLVFDEQNQLITVADETRVWKLGQAKAFRRILAPFDFVKDLSGDGRYAAVFESEQWLRVVPAGVNDPGAGIRLPDQKNARAMLSPDGKYVAIAFAAGTAGAGTVEVRLGQRQTAEPLCRVLAELHTEEPGAPLFAKVAFSRKQDRMAVAGKKGLKVYELSPGCPGRELPLKGVDLVQSVAFAEAGDRVAVVTTPGLLMVWDVATGLRSAPPMMDGAFLQEAEFNRAGDRLMTRWKDGARLWDARSGLPASVKFGMQNQDLSAIALSPDGQWMALAANDGKVLVRRIWMDLPDAREAAVWAELAGVASGLRLSALGRRDPEPLPLDDWIRRVERLRKLAAGGGKTGVALFLREYLRLNPPQ